MAHIYRIFFVFGLLFTMIACGREIGSTSTGSGNAPSSTRTETLQDSVLNATIPVQITSVPVKPTLTDRDKTLTALRDFIPATPIGTVTAGGNGWFIPEPPPYPAMRDLRVDIDSSQSIRTTVFTTTDTPQQVISFYRDVLSSQAWQIDQSLNTGADLTMYWSPSAEYPAFNLWITANQQDILTEVTLIQQISGPFPVFFPTSTPTQ